MKFPGDLLRQCCFLAGPTASGKSALAMLLAEHFNGEIVSMDSMAIYRKMDIGTAKPTRMERQQVPHHLIDLVEPHEEFSTAEYFTAAQRSCEEIVLRGKTPVFTGGTGLYLRAILRGVFEGPPADWDFRNRLLAAASEQPGLWLHRQLQQVDAPSALRLHPNDTRRLVRALEIHALTGEAASTLQREHPLPAEERPAKVFWLHPPRAWLHDRINSRVVRMFEMGLEAETRELLQLPQSLSRTASQALGYREVIDWIEGRLSNQTECLELIQTRTRQFAKRQHTWFRNLVECREVPMTGAESGEELCARLLSLSSNSE